MAHGGSGIVISSRSGHQAGTPDNGGVTAAYWYGDVAEVRTQ